MESLLRCPLCAQPLDRQDTRYLCPRGHSFDRAAAGYVHLLPANKLHSKDPGDDKAMAAARNRFLSGGYYDPLRDALTRLALAYAPDRAQILDAGCGEGYYSAALFQALLQAGKHPRMAGVDLSKHALRRAAKRQGSIEFAVASVYDLPVADQQIDLLVNCFSPLAPAGSTAMWFPAPATCGSSSRCSMTRLIPTRKKKPHTPASLTRKFRRWTAPSICRIPRPSWTCFK